MSRDIRAGRAFVELYTKNSKMIRGLANAKRRLREFGASATMIGRQMTLTGGGVLAGLGLSAKQFGDFDKNMRMVSTMLTQPKEHMARFRTEIKAMALEFGEATDSLAKGLYNILSASVAPEKAMSVLRVTMKAAIAGNTDAATSTQALINVLNAYHIPAEQAADASDLLFQIVRRGVLTFDDLASNIGLVTSTAYGSGLGFEELGASIATMTRNGLKAERSVIALNNMMKTFVAPTEDSKKAAREFGIELSSNTLKTLGLVGVFEKLKDATPEDIAIIFPNIRELRGIMAIRGDLTGLAIDIDMMTDRAGATDAAFEKMADGIAFQFGRVKQAAIQMVMAIGKSIESPLLKLFEGFTVLGPLATSIVGDYPKVTKVIAAVAAGVTAAGFALMGLGLTAQLVGMGIAAIMSVVGGVTSILTATISPALAVGAAIAAIGVGLVYLARNTKPVEAVRKAVKGYAIDIRDMVSVVVEDATTAWGAIKAAISAGDTEKAMKVVTTTLELEWHRLVSAWMNVTRGFRSWWSDVTFGFASMFIDATAKIETAWAGMLGAMKKGWIDFRTSTFTEWLAKTMAPLSDETGENKVSTLGTSDPRTYRKGRSFVNWLMSSQGLTNEEVKAAITEDMEWQRGQGESGKIEEETKARQDKLEADRKGAQDALGDMVTEENNKRREGIALAEKELKLAIKARDEAVIPALGAGQEAAIEAQRKLDQLIIGGGFGPDFAVQLAGAASNIAGTFSGSEARGMGMGSGGPEVVELKKANKLAVDAAAVERRVLTVLEDMDWMLAP